MNAWEWIKQEQEKTEYGDGFWECVIAEITGLDYYKKVKNTPEFNRGWDDAEGIVFDRLLYTYNPENYE